MNRFWYNCNFRISRDNEAWQTEQALLSTLRMLVFHLRLHRFLGLEGAEHVCDEGPSFPPSSV